MIGVYRLTMKDGSDNFRQSSVLKLVERLQSNKIKVVAYEPLIDKSNFHGMTIVSDFDCFKNMVSLIITNRKDPLLNDIGVPVFTRDVFGKN